MAFSNAVDSFHYGYLVFNAPIVAGGIGIARISRATYQRKPDKLSET